MATFYVYTTAPEYDGLNLSAPSRTYLFDSEAKLEFFISEWEQSHEPGLIRRYTDLIEASPTVTLNDSSVTLIYSAPYDTYYFDYSDQYQNDVVVSFISPSETTSIEYTDYLPYLTVYPDYDTAVPYYSTDGQGTITKFDTDGTVLWSRINTDWFGPIDFYADPDGNLFATFYNGLSLNGLWIDPDGNETAVCNINPPGFDYIAVFDRTTEYFYIVLPRYPKTYNSTTYIYNKYGTLLQTVVDSDFSYTASGLNWAVAYDSDVYLGISTTIDEAPVHGIFKNGLSNLIYDLGAVSYSPEFLTLSPNNNIYFICDSVTEVIVRAITTSGAELWNYSFSTDDFSFDDTISVLHFNENEDCVVTLETSTGYSSFLFDSTGTLIWEKEEIVVGIDNDRSYYMYDPDTYTVTKYDVNDNLVYTTNEDGIGYGISSPNSGGIIIQLLGNVEVTGIVPSSLGMFETDTGTPVTVCVLESPGLVEVTGIAPSELFGASVELDTSPGIVHVIGCEGIDVGLYLDLPSPGLVHIIGCVPVPAISVTEDITTPEITFAGVDPESITGSDITVVPEQPGLVHVIGKTPILYWYSEGALSYTLNLTTPGSVEVIGIAPSSLYFMTPVRKSFISCNSFGQQKGVVYKEGGELQISIDTINMISDNISVSFDSINSLLSAITYSEDGILKSFAVKNVISEGLLKTISTLLTISSEPITKEFDSQNVISETDAIQFTIDFLISLSNPEYVGSFISRSVYFDGRDITKWCKSVLISRSQDTVCNSVSISSISEELYYLVDPYVRIGEIRIEVHIGSEVFQFLLENRDSNATGDLSFGGRDPSARETELFQEVDEFLIDDPTLASELVADVAVVSVVDWDSGCEDWVVPDTFSFTGVPIDAIISVAQEIGAVVRAQEDGSLLVRKKYTTRPINVPSATAVVSYDQKELISLGKTEAIKKLIDAVKVINEFDLDSFLPNMELEEDSPIIGDTIHIKVYWAGNQNTTFKRYVTNGLVKSLGTFSETITDELIEFVNSKASTSYPLVSIISNAWYGDDGTITVESDKTLSIGLETDQLFRIGTITYTTEFERLEVSKSNVPYLLTVLYLNSLESGGYTIDIIASDAADPPVYGDTLTTKYLTDESSIRERGTVVIDDNHYNYADVSFEAVHEPLAKDGTVIYINDARIGERGNYYVISSDIIIEGPKITDRITARKWEL